MIYFVVHGFVDVHGGGVIVGVGPENWKPGPLHIKGPKPRPRSPIVRDTQ